MRVEQVRIDPAAAPIVGVGRVHERQQSPHHAVGSLGVVQPRPQAQPPAHAPTRCVVASDVHGPANGLSQQGRAAGRDLVTGVCAVEVGEVAVGHFGLHEVVGPFLQLAPRPDLVGEDALAGLPQAGGELAIHTQNLACADAVGEQLSSDRQIHGGADARRNRPTVGRPEGKFGRRRGGCDQIRPSLGVLRRLGATVFDQPIEAELGSAAHHGPHLGERCSIQAESVAFPQVLAQPSASVGPIRPNGVAGQLADGRRVPPEVRVVVRHPALHAVVLAGHARPRGDQLLRHAEQRLVALGQVGRLGGPVVHLGVDVQRVVRTPRWPNVVVPDALQVGGLRSGPR